MKWIAGSIALIAVVGLVIGWRATTHHPPKRCYTGQWHNIPVDCP